MAREPDPTLLRLQSILDGTRLHAALVATLEVRLCEHLAQGPATASELAWRAGLSGRGAQALLDALVALGLVEVSAGRYANGPGADAYLVPGRPGYLGDELIGLYPMQLESFARLADSARSGAPALDDDSTALIAYFAQLTPLLARRLRPVADFAVRHLHLERGAPALLDVGGGLALYSLALFRLNPEARAAQADWPVINDKARAAVRAAGFDETRFDTLDGDLRTMTFPEARFDVAVLSNIVHSLAEPAILDLLGRVRRAIRPGGRVLVAEYVVDDGRAGPARPLLFNLTMLVHSRAGKSYERGELAGLLEAAGFTAPQFTPIEGTDTTLAVAGRGA